MNKESKHGVAMNKSLTGKKINLSPLFSMRCLSKSFKLILGGILFLSLLAGCGGGGGGGGSSSDSGSSGSEDSATATIGSEGGTVATSNGKVTLNIPAGALTGNTILTVSKTTDVPSGNISDAYNFGPDGTIFDDEVEVTFNYDPIGLPNGINESDLRIGTVVDGQWRLVTESVVNTNSHSITGILDHFSPKGIVTKDTTWEGIAIPETSVPTISSLSMPVGTNRTDLSKLNLPTINTSSYPISFEKDDQGNDVWYVYTAFNENKTSDGGNYIDFNNDGGYDFHPGEDWNKTDGKDKDKGVDVYPIAKGVVIYKSGTCHSKTEEPASPVCDNTDWKKHGKGYGNTVILLHKTISGEYITSFYGHLMDYDPDNLNNSDYQKFNEGEEIDITTPIGKIGTTGTGDCGWDKSKGMCTKPYSPAYHLHFEIRKETMVEKLTNGTIKLKFNPSMWPSSRKKDDQGNWISGTSPDNGKTFIDENYYDPSDFIKNYLNQYKSDATTYIQEGSSTTENTVVFQGRISDPASDRNVKLSIELRRLDEYNGSFTGQATQESGYVASGEIAKITVYGLINGNYHWRARVVNDQGVATDWAEFGKEGNTDFVIGTTVDIVSPSIPTNLAATVASSSQINLSWTASTDNIGVAGYKIYRGGTYLKSVTTTSTSDTGLSPSTQYCYTVSAYDAAGNESSQSSQVCAVTSAAGYAPSAPTGVTVSSGNGQVTISWNPVSGTDSYNIYWSTTSGVSKTYFMGNIPATSPYIHTALTNGTTYYYVVTAVNSYGESLESTQVSATPYITGTAPSAPTSVSATAGNSQATISWNAVSGATSYNIYWSTEPAYILLVSLPPPPGSDRPSYTHFSVSTASYTHTGLTNGTTYYYGVTAVNSYGESNVSSEVKATPRTGTAAVILPKTGQSNSAAWLDDGGLQKGVSWPNPRFTVSGDCVTDNLTGLMWVQSPDSTTRTWQQSLDYANNLTLCGYSDWRLPNRKELRSLINYGQSNSASWLNSQGFSNALANHYWSSTTYAAPTGVAWIINMGDGGVEGGDKSSIRYVWPVRAGQGEYASTINLPETGQTTCYDSSGNVISCTNTGQDGDIKAGVAWPSPRFAAGTGAEADCVTDNLTGLMWVQSPDSITRTWYQSLDYANNLTLCGYTDWRLPNVNELESLINAEQPNSATWLNTQGFSNVRADDYGNYWSSTIVDYTIFAGTGTAWIVRIPWGPVAYYAFSNSNYVLPVRGWSGGQ